MIGLTNKMTTFTDPSDYFKQKSKTNKNLIKRFKLIPLRLTKTTEGNEKVKEVTTEKKRVE